MALALTPRLLRRGLELFAIISLAGVIVVLAVYGENVQAVGGALLHQPHDLRNPGHRDADRDGVPGLAAGCRALAGRPPRAQEPPDRGPHRAAARGHRPGA